MSSYKVVRKIKLSDLEHDVNEMIEQGYAPVGGIAFEPERKYSMRYYLQAVYYVGQPDEPTPV